MVIGLYNVDLPDENGRHNPSLVLGPHQFSFRKHPLEQSQSANET